MEYRKVFQTWSLLSPTDVVHSPASCTIQKEAPDAGRVISPSVFRMNVQHLRIKRRLSVSDLASMVNCDAQTLAAYEEGQELLDEKIVTRIENALKDDQKSNK